MGKTVYTSDGRYEWDETKSELNKQKHGFTFEEILEVFDDPYILTQYDIAHSADEDRYWSIGSINGVLVIVVYYTERDGRTRIISARQAESALQEVYNGYVAKINGGTN